MGGALAGLVIYIPLTNQYSSPPRHTDSHTRAQWSPSVTVTTINIKTQDAPLEPFCVFTGCVGDICDGGSGPRE